MKQKTILLVTMSLGIGGAETHFVELACSLKADGYEVITTSNGGIYEKRLAENGIQHYKVPLNSRNLISMFKGYRTLCKIVRNKNIDIIHAHARIPAFLSGFVSRKTGVPLISTVHGTYSTKGILKIVSNWGEKSLAVSPDLKKYLIDNYGISPANITLTVNGINTDVFRPMPVNENIMKEFSLPKEVKKILCISRLDPDSSAGAYDLCSQIEKIDKSFPGVTAIIVGDGSQYDDLFEKAKNVNNKLGRNAVILTGARTDIPSLLSIADVVVGLSRVALEAMSCEKPVIIAGTYGYLGLFKNTVLDACINTNFTARGYERPHKDSMSDDIISVLSLDTEKITSLCKFGRQVVIKNYSVDRMARDAENVYNSVKVKDLRKQFDFALMGYYGYQNSGDDALLLSIIQNLRIKMPDVSLCVITNQPEQCHMETGAKCVYRFNMFGILKTLLRSKVLIYGGGNLIQDITSTKSLLYYTSILRLAQIMGVKTMLYSNGIGPVIRESNKNITRKVLENVDLITLREEGSLRFLKKCGIDSPSIHLTADETLTLTPLSKEKSRQILIEKGFSPDRPFLCVSVRPWKYSKENFKTELANALDYISRKYNMSILFLPMHGNQDENFSSCVAHLMKTDSFILKGSYNASTLMGIISLSKMVIGMRLHSLIYGFGAEVPLLGIVYDEKVLAFMNSAGGSEFVINVSSFNSEELIYLIKGLSLNYEKISQIQKERLSKLKFLAQSNSDYAIELLSNSTKDGDKL